MMEPRNGYSRGKPTVSSGWKAAVLGALGRVRRTPPGSESGACLQRGNSGTWESHLSPCLMTGMGDRLIKGPGVVLGASPRSRAREGHHELWEHARYREASDKRSDPRGAGWQS